MKVTDLDEANKIWKRIAKDASEDELKFSLEIYKKLLSFFQVGDYHYYNFNLKQSCFWTDKQRNHLYSMVPFRWSGCPLFC